MIALDAQLAASQKTAALQLLREATIHGAGDIVSTNLAPAIRWELAQGFGLMDDRTGRPDVGVMRALLRRP